MEQTPELCEWRYDNDEEDEWLSDRIADTLAT